jgi:D-alanine-D-alanine ligase|nr:hypothetical protein [Kofleriaceae bacterium]
MKIAVTYNEKRSLDERDAEFDTRDAIDGVARRVAALGHDVVAIDVTGSIARLERELARAAPDVVLNFAEGERGAFREAFYPALFAQLGLRCTGSAPSALALCMDKQLAKRVVAAAGVDVPRDDGERVIVKPRFEGSSKGITAASVMARGELAAALPAARARYPDGVIVEELVPGIDVAVGWVAGLGLLPPMWARYDGEIYDYALKHVTPERVQVVIPAPLAPPVRAALDDAARRAFDALGVRGYGRADFRVSPAGRVVFLEMNPLPSLTFATGHDELYAAAAAAGHDPPSLLSAILAAAG